MAQLPPARDHIEALADADRLVEELAGTPGAITYRGVMRPAWVDRVVAEHNRVVQAGEGTLCRHLAVGYGVANIAAWAPGHGYCSTCVVDDLLPMPKDTPEEHTCDACRRYLPGRVTGAVFQLGSVLLLYGVCVDCRPESSPL